MRRIARWVKRLTAFRIGLATGFVFALLHLWEVGTRQPLPLLGRLESALLDARFRQRGQVRHSGRVVIAAIDEAAIAKFGRWPWDRRVLARLDHDHALAQAIRRASARVALGVIAQTVPEMGAFQDAGVEENVRRVEASQIAPPEFRYRLSGGAEKADPVASTWIKEYPGLRSPLPPIAAAAGSFGFFNALPDADGAIRQAALAMRVRGRYLPSLDAVLVAAALRIPPSRIVPVAADDGSGGRANVDGCDFGGKLFVPTD